MIVAFFSEKVLFLICRDVQYMRHASHVQHLFMFYNSEKHQTIVPSQILKWAFMSIWIIMMFLRSVWKSSPIRYRAHGSSLFINLFSRANIVIWMKKFLFIFIVRALAFNHFLIKDNESYYSIVLNLLIKSFNFIKSAINLLIVVKQNLIIKENIAFCLLFLSLELIHWRWVLILKEKH